MIDTAVDKTGTASPQLEPAGKPAPKKAADAPAAKKKETGLKGPWMYVGPTIPGLGIQGRVYAAIPSEVHQKEEEMPEIGLLFIPVRDYPMANRMLREGAGYIYDAYRKVMGMKKGGGGHE